MTMGRVVSPLLAILALFWPLAALLFSPRVVGRCQSRERSDAANAGEES